jgi:hypothetical protein
MAIRKEILNSFESEVWLKDFHLSANGNLLLEGSDDWSLSKRTLEEGPSAGIAVVFLNDPDFIIAVAARIAEQ